MSYERGYVREEVADVIELRYFRCRYYKKVGRRVCESFFRLDKFREEARRRNARKFEIYYRGFRLYPENRPYTRESKIRRGIIIGQRLITERFPELEVTKEEGVKRVPVTVVYYARPLEEWVRMVYVITARYAQTGRHVEAHFESDVLNTERDKMEAVRIAHKVLVAWVTSRDYLTPVITIKAKREDLRREAERIEREIISTIAMEEMARTLAGWEWIWGVQFKNPRRVRRKRKNFIRMHVYDYDYAAYRREDVISLPAIIRETGEKVPVKWWRVRDADEKILALIYTRETARSLILSMFGGVSLRVHGAPMPTLRRWME